MLNQSKKSSIIIHALLLSVSSHIKPSLAIEYFTVAGSQVIIKSIQGSLPPTGSNAIGNFSPGITSNSPLLGGFSTGQGNCVINSSAIEVDGRKGVKLNEQNIIAGFTGSISNGIVTIKQDSTGMQQTYRGGLIFDPRGIATAQGDVLQSSANTFCGGFTAPYGDVNNPTDNLLTTPDNTSWGNSLASIDGFLWIYVPLNTPFGSYPLSSILFSQGPTLGLYSSMPVTQSGDTMVVTPPPCTISTRTDIIFNASSAAMMKESAPISYQCGSVENQSVLDAYMIVTAISETLTSTELALTIDGNKAGGIVRGYAGTGIDLSDANCTDTANSIMFNGSFNTKLGAVASGTLSIPLIWQLCTQGDEPPGQATGSVLLDIGYK